MEKFGRKQPAPDFVIRFTGSEIKPWNVPTRALARALQAVQRIVDQREEDEDGSPIMSEVRFPIAEDTASKSLRLIAVRNSSAAYAVAAPAHDFAVSLIGATGKGIQSPEMFNWTSATLSAVRELSDIARSLGPIELRLPGGRHYGDRLAAITGDTFREITKSVFIEGETTIFAKIERVGGATEMHCGIRLPEQPRKMVICHVDGAELVRQLGKYLYQHVLLSGHATWLRHGRQLKYFRVVSFEPPKTGSIPDALERIYDAGGKAWDRVKNPDKKIAEIRGLS